MKSFSELVALANTHFKGIYTEPPIATLAEVMHIAQSYPRFMDQEVEQELTKEVTLEELEATLKWLKKDKSPGLDG